jgi:adenylylsulfate kinase-like enzyme
MGTQKVCFIHIPRSAGASTISFLDDNYSLRDILFAWNPRDLLAFPPEKLQTYPLVRGHFFFQMAKRLLPDHQFVTVLRDPCERYLSIYNWLHTMHLETEIESSRQAAQQVNGIQSGISEISKNGIAKVIDMSFDDFLRSNDPVVKLMSCNNLTSYLGTVKEKLYCYDPAIESASTYLPGNDEYLEATKALNKFSIIGLTEDLAKSTLLMCHHFCWMVPDTIDHIHNLRRGKREEISDAALELIHRNNKYDISLYNHAKQIFSSQWRKLVEDVGDDDIMRIKKHINTRYQVARFYSIPYQQYIDESAHCAWPGTFWGRRNINAMQQSWRFMKNSGACLFIKPLPVSDYIFTLYIYTASSPKVIDALTLAINGKPTEFVASGVLNGFPYKSWRLRKRDIHPDHAKTILTVQIEDALQENADQADQLAFSRYTLEPESESDAQQPEPSQARAEAPVIWFSGCPGSGRLLIARRVAGALAQRQARAFILDEETASRFLGGEAHWTHLSDREKALGVAEIANSIAGLGVAVLVTINVNSRLNRSLASKRILTRRLFEVFCRRSLSKCEQHYALSSNNMESTNCEFLSSLMADFEPPICPNLYLDTDMLSVEECAAAVLREIPGGPTYCEDTASASAHDGSNTGALYDRAKRVLRRFAKTLGGRKPAQAD